VAVAAAGFAAAAVLGPTAVARQSAFAFDPRSVTFVSTQTGWVIGTGACGAARCLQLRRTADSGRSWTTLRLPAALVAAAERKVEGKPAYLYSEQGLNVRFADTRNGWIWGDLPVQDASGITDRATVWATHDGGRIWRSLGPSWLRGSSSILDLEAVAGEAYLLALGNGSIVRVAGSPVVRDGWRVEATPRLGLPAGGSELEGAIVLSGSNGWLVEGNDRGTTGSARLVGGRWVSWVPPCASVGGTFAIPAAPTPADLVAACVMGGFASPLPKAAPPGATLGSTWLYVSRNGRSFRAGPEIGRRGTYFGVLASPRPGAIVVARVKGQRDDLRASFDGGRRWTTVYRGDVAYLGFTTAVQGVAILGRPDGTHQLLMTFDGGRHWAPVRF
jgi:hypothetical protein